MIDFQCVTIDSLPNNVFLDIFDFYQIDAVLYHSWLRLVHVCRRWRSVVFASPHRLGLQLTCRATTPVREILDVWPPMQIIIDDSQPTRLGGDNIIAALEHRDRVCEIRLSYLTSSLLERLAAVMQRPFPVLTYLRLESHDQTPLRPLVFPDTFLGGSAPRLQSLNLSRIPFPAIPRHLSYATDLVDISLLIIPDTGYIPPDVMATSLSALTKLERLEIRFKSPPSRPEQRIRRLPPQIRTVLPALTKLKFCGVNEYLEDFLAQIDTPIISTTTTIFFNRVNFHIPQLLQFVGRAQTLEPFTRAWLSFRPGAARIEFHQSNRPSGEERSFEDAFLIVIVWCDAIDWQLSFFVQICGQLSPLLSSVEWLDIECDAIGPSDWKEGVDDTQWLEIFRPFIAVQSLHIPGLGRLIAPALQELTGVRVIEVLPTLCNLFLTGSDPSGSVRQAIEPFITARQLSNQPVTVYW